jgi:hypothetical protein
MNMKLKILTNAKKENIRNMRKYIKQLCRLKSPEVTVAQSAHGCAAEFESLIAITQTDCRTN